MVLSPNEVLVTLEEMHSRLDAHFRSLHDRRSAIAGTPPVFALEHGLSTAEVESLNSTVKQAVANGFRALHRRWWLPFVIYAAEAGYDYEGNEYWPSFEEKTPGWKDNGDRNRIRAWFQKFHSEYGGAEPRGAYAEAFRIISWPITHAILPVYLQRFLAELLFEFRRGLTSALLEDPEELGLALHNRAFGYTERFRVFCENTSLLGQVAVALLSGQDEESPYLERSTLHRLVEGLERERQAKEWLNAARNAAHHARARGLLSVGRHGDRAAPSRIQLPRPTDPRLVLRNAESGWQLFAEMPDLRPLANRLPHVYKELRTRRARIQGAEGSVLARGRLTAPGQIVRMTHLPDPLQPFIDLEGASEQVNQLLADQVMLSRGAFRLFKQRTKGHAGEIKSQVVHPGHSYLVVHDGTWVSPSWDWKQDVRTDLQNATVTRLQVPESLSAADTTSLVDAGLSVGTDIAIRPVGIVAKEWDGEGSVEWLVGETGIIGISAQQTPVGCSVNLNGERKSIQWPEGESELFLALEDLPIGIHELHIGLVQEDVSSHAEGTLQITVSDPLVRTEGAEPGEGIRLLASPARPTMSELWKPETLTIEGPDGLEVELRLTLRSETGASLDSIRQQLKLPMLASDWQGVARKVQSDHKFGKHFDDAERIELTVFRASIGQASLTVDRGFQPLRWKVARDRESAVARLVDRTDSGTTSVELFTVNEPLTADAHSSLEDIRVPSNGGLLRAVSGSHAATQLLPTNPNEVRSVLAQPFVRTGARTTQEVMRLVRGYRLWADADLPGDLFAQHQRREVLLAISQAVVSLISDGHWASIERRVAKANDPSDLFEDMQKAVGDNGLQREMARNIAYSLYDWLNPAALLSGFDAAASRVIQASGIKGRPSTARFLLTLAGRPGSITDWYEREREFLLQKVMDAPVLLRAARFAVLGTRALNTDGNMEKGF